MVWNQIAMLFCCNGTYFASDTVWRPPRASLAFQSLRMLKSCFAYRTVRSLPTGFWMRLSTETRRMLGDLVAYTHIKNPDPRRRRYRYYCKSRPLAYRPR